jgi:hypothetical protein
MFINVKVKFNKNIHKLKLSILTKCKHLSAVFTQMMMHKILT